MLQPSTLSPNAAKLRKVIPAGDYWIDNVAKHQRLRIVDVEGNQSADTL